MPLLRNSDIQHEVEPQLIYNEVCKQLIYKIINNYGMSGQVEVIIDKSLYGDRGQSLMLTWLIDLEW